VTAQAIRSLRDLLEETRLEVPGVNADVTGGSVLELDEMNQSQWDSTLATIVSLVLVALIFIYGYHETGRPLKAMFCLLIGLCYSMGYTTLTVGRLNILTITFEPMLVGMAIDFGVHLITRYEEELRNGVVRQLRCARPLVTPAWNRHPTPSPPLARSLYGVHRLPGVGDGNHHGGGLLVCLVPMMTMLPVLPSAPSEPRRPRRREIRQPLRERVDLVGPSQLGDLRRTRLVCRGPFRCRRVYFDYDLRNLQTRTSGGCYERN
jgi:hypothetical protein